MHEPLKGKRVLIVTPSFPIPETGAEQSDRGNGIRQFKRLGADVIVIAKVTSHSDKEFIQKTANELGVQVVMVPYRYSGLTLSLKEKVLKHLGKLRHPLYLDGAAYEYAEPVVQEALRRQLDEFKPDVVWFEYTYLWPLYSMVRERNVPIITRSINFEPQHFLEEDGYTFKNYLKFVPKFIGEWLTVRRTDVMLSITPKEEQIYRILGSKVALTLPLRGLPRFISTPEIEMRDKKPLHAFFMGSSYRVAHNAAALRYILRDIAPLVEKSEPGSFVFHVLGSKVPSSLEKYFGSNVIYDGPKYHEELEEFLAIMDVAIVPSLMGAGQQQKVFEPLTRGFPTVTSDRAIANYPFQPNVHYLAAHTPQEFADMLLSLTLQRRDRLSKNARIGTSEVFAQEMLDMVVVGSVMKAIKDKKSSAR